MLPQWLINLTNADKFAPGGNPNFGDALQGIGSSMLNHYRGTAPVSRGGPSSAPVTPMDPALAAVVKAPPIAQVPLPARTPFPTSNWGGLQPILQDALNVGRNRQP